jgi:hypothetical protein
MSLERPLESLSDDDLLRGLSLLLRQSRRVESHLVAHIGEVETRHLYAREASPSMFVYCTDILHLSEAESYLRINVARAAREHPVLLAMLADGRLHLTGIAKLAPHLTRENRDLLLSRAVHKSKRQIEELLAELFPRPDAPSVVRKLPERPSLPGGSGPAEAPRLELGLDGVQGSASPPRPDALPRPVPAPPALVQPLSPARYKVQFTAGAQLYDKLERLRALLRPEVPDGDLASIIEKAVTEKLERLEARRFARTSSPKKMPVPTNPSSRHIPAAVRRVVHERDGGRCCFVDAQGRRCPARHRLEYHHRRPFGLGGGPDVDNICLMCPAHNRLMAELDYGRKAMCRHWGSTRETRADRISPAEMTGTVPPRAPDARTGPERVGR